MNPFDAVVDAPHARGIQGGAQGMAVHRRRAWPAAGERQSWSTSHLTFSRWPSPGLSRAGAELDLLAAVGLSAPGTMLPCQTANGRVTV